MRINPYGMMALVILAISTPSLVLAETENEANEGVNNVYEKQSASTTTDTEREGNNNNSSSYANSNLILYATIAAIVSIVVYSAWKVYKMRRKVPSKTTV